MSTLNEPTDWKPEPAEPDWTPASGLLRGAVYGLIVALGIAVLLVPVAKWAPTLLLNAYLRVALGFAVTGSLAAAVQRGAGMVGWPCTGLAVGLAVLVLVTNHVVFAICGVPTRSGLVVGWAWLDPGVLFGMNLLALVGVGSAGALCHRGSDIVDTVVDILMQNPLTGRR
jgi:hypothetical protein